MKKALFLVSLIAVACGIYVLRLPSEDSAVSVAPKVKFDPTPLVKEETFTYTAFPEIPESQDALDIKAERAPIITGPAADILKEIAYSSHGSAGVENNP